MAIENPGSAAPGLELKIPPPVVALVVGAMMWGIARLAPTAAVPGVARHLLAAVLAAVGVVLAVSGVWMFRKFGTTVRPEKPENATALVTNGIYRFTRNPMYLGLTTVLTAWAVWLGVLWTLIGPVSFVLYIRRFQILPEERALTRLFGEHFVAYCGRVRRWI